jgi:hypothetical protein
MIPPNRLVVAMLILMGLVLVVVGCDIGLSGPNSITCNSDFSPLLPPDWKIVSQSKLENENSTELRCVAFYRFDVPRNGWGKVAVGGTVFRVDRNRPNDIHAYPLSLPDGHYLGENQVSARPLDVLSDLEGKEVVIEDKLGDLVVEASIFSEQDIENSEDNPYKSRGWFIGDGGVKVELDKVTTWTRRLGTRSQLADRRTYTPRENQTYYQKGSAKLVDPGTPVLVSLSMPEDPATSEYPEKVVLAFYESLTDTDKLRGLMTTAAFTTFVKTDPIYGCLNSSLPANVLVKDIGYVQASPVPSHTENSNVIITATVTATSTCLINGRSSGRDLPLTWLVVWKKYDDKGNDWDRWMLLKPTVKP